MVKQLRLFPNMPRERSTLRPLRLTPKRADILTRVMASASNGLVIKPFERAYLRLLIAHGYVTVVAHSPARYLVTERGMAARRSYQRRVHENFANLR